MSRKRKNNTSEEIRELKEKIRRLERNCSRDRSRRNRLLSSSSECSTTQSPIISLPKKSSKPRRRSTIPHYGVDSQDDSSGLEINSEFSLAPPSEQSVKVMEGHVHASPKNSNVIITQAQVHASPTNSRGILDHAQQSAAHSAESINLADGTDPSKEEARNVDTIVEQELNSNMLEILGDDPSVLKTYGKDIQKDLAIRFNHIATNGLSKGIRKEVREKYPIPANCTLIDAPQINPEIKAAISEAAYRRLGGMEQKQKQLACAISCLGEAITLVLSQNDTDPRLLRLLMDAGRIICDTQYCDSLTRRFIIMALLKKEIKNQLLPTKIDSFLFGNNLSETLKTAKAISRSGVELRQPQVSTSSNWKSNNKRICNRKNNLNSKTPPSSHRSTGNSRNLIPAPRNQPVSSSKSFRATPRHYHR